MQINDVVGGQMINRTGISHLADNNVVADSGPGHRFNIGEPERLSLIKANIGLRRLRLQSRIVRCVSLTPGFYDVGAKFLAVATQG